MRDTHAAISHALTAAQEHLDRPKPGEVRTALREAAEAVCGACKLTDHCQNPAGCIKRGMCLWTAHNEALSCPFQQGCPTPDDCLDGCRGEA